jgi:RHS repeat-associated protein
MIQKNIWQAVEKALILLHILCATSLCTQQAQAQINFVRTWDATAPEQDGNALIVRPVKDVKTTTQYIDGLGRPIQTVVKQGSLQSSNNEFADIVAPIVYDEFGREAMKYLPFAANNAGGNTAINNGAYKTNALVQQQAFAAIQYPNETHFYSKTNFEPSPLNRPTDSYAPGNSWAGSETATPALQRNVQMKYFINTLIDDVKIWNVNNDPVIGNFGTYTIATNINGGIYPAGELYKNITIDEHKKQAIEFKDKEGKVILKKVQIGNITDNGAGVNNTDFLCTYYIYDDLNNHRCVIQPEGVRKLAESNWQLATANPTAYATLLAEQCFRYEYDARNRMVKKKVPGAGEVCMVYDERDRLILTQDANMRVGTVKWLYTKYDELNRPIASGLWPSTLTYTQHAANTINNLAYPPLAAEEELSRTFYDNYTWLTNPLYTNPLSAIYNIAYDTYFQPVSNTTWPYPQANAQSIAIKGMVTGSRTKALGTANTYLYSIPFYDEKGRAIQSQSTNITGGIDIATTQYTWAGQPLVMVSKQQKAGGTLQETVTVSQMTYDDLGRVTKTEKKLSNTLVNGGAMAAYKTIAENKYDKLGQLINKNLGTKPTAAAPLAKLAYEYNIRGWLTSVNKNFVAAGNNGANNDEYFGMQLGYDKDAFGSFTKKAYNGNIAGTIWRSAGDGIDRKYDYDYDAANRLLKADFTQHDGSAFTTNPLINFNVKMGDGINANTAYDDNGNIKQMQQWGLKINASPQIDNLSYTYITGSNKLAKVTDTFNDPTTKLGDFKDGTNTNDDYLYDANGNLNLDNNKAISSITYNHLNLPSVINITGKGSIAYTYDAGGNKLRKVTLENPIATNNNKTITTTTNYINGLVYESKTTSPANTPTTDYVDVLQFIPQEEGRIRFKPAVGAVPASFAYDYMLKDHLGNVRVVITEEQQQDVYPAATLEPALVAAEMNYYAIDPSRFKLQSEIPSLNNPVVNYWNNNITTLLKPNNNPSCTGNLCTNANSTKLYRLKSSEAKTGLGITLKVMAGDKIDVAGKSYFFESSVPPSTNNLSILNIITGFLGGATGAAATSVHGAVSPAQIDPGTTNPTVNDFFTNQSNQTTTNKPRAFINVIFFDEQFKLVDYKVSVVGNSGALKDHYDDLKNIAATKSGFVYIYCSNETNIDVYFDNVQVVHTRSALLETNEYYAFGLKMDGISYRAANSMESRHKFNGIEQENDFDLNYLEAFYRTIDPQIGRFLQIDPVTTHGESPYVMMGNNPIRNSDWLGNYFTWANSTVHDTYDRMRQQNTERKSDAFGKILNILQSGEKMGKEIESLSAQVNSYAKLDEQWDAMESSDVEFNVSSESSSRNSGGDTRYDFEKNRVAVRLGKNEKDVSVLSHEIRHAYGYMIGELVGSAQGDPLYDIMDEVVAYNVGASHSSLNSQYTSFVNKKINLDWFKNGLLKNPLYTHLGGKEEQLTLNTPAAILLKYTTDNYIVSYINRNSSNINLTVKDVFNAVNDLDRKANPPRPLTYIFGDDLKNR